MLDAKSSEDEEPTLYDECSEKVRLFNEQDKKIQSFYKNSPELFH